MSNIVLAAGSDDSYQISRSVRLRSSATATFTRTPSTTTNNKTFTWSGWVKRGTMPSYSPLITTKSQGSSAGYLQTAFFLSDSTLCFALSNSIGGNTIYANTTAVFRDPSAWYHIVLAVDTTQATGANGIKMYVNGVQQTLNISAYSQNATTYFNTSGVIHYIGWEDYHTAYYFDGYLTEINFIDGQALTPSSFGENDSITGVWKPKKYVGTYGTNGFYLPFSNPTLSADITAGATATAPSGGTANNAKVSDGTYLLTNASTGSAFDIVKYDFGTPQQITKYFLGAAYFSGGTATWQLQVSNDDVNYTVAASIGVTATGTNYSGTINVNARYVKLRCTSFGTNGQAGLDVLQMLQDGIGADGSGQGNHWVPNNISLTAGVTYDSMIDTPTPYADGGNGRGNYAVLNPLDNQATLSNGNLTQTTGAAERGCRSTFAIPDSGLWYAEAIVSSTTTAATISAAFGLATAGFSLSASAYNTAGAWDLYSSNFAYINRNGSVSGSLGYTLTAGDIVQIAVDPANSRAWIGRNNTWYDGSNGTTGNPSGGTNPTFTSLPAGLFVFVNGYNETWNANFGQRPFAYTPPTGFKALNTQNLPDSTIKKGNKYFDAALSTSGGASGRTVSSLNFQPDFLWDKPRSSIQDHILADAVRGLSLNLTTNTTAAEVTRSTFFTGVSSNGFTIGSGDFGAGYSCVTWCWKKGATQGFDIVTYTGNGANPQAVSHSLGVVPKMIIVKVRNLAGQDWYVYHASNGATPQNNCLFLESTSASLAVPTAWNNQAPTSSAFYVGNNNAVNGAGYTYVAYLFAEVAGFSKFGSYTGNGSADGPFVYCGFRPKFVMLKRTDAAASWYMLDTSRGTYNVVNPYVLANASNGEATDLSWDLLSNGFKLRSSYSEINTSGATMIFAAFAENPFKNSLAR